MLVIVSFVMLINGLKPKPTSSNFNVIAYSLFGGNNSRYIDGAYANTRLVASIYNGWYMWIYHDNSLPIETLTYLLSHNYVRLINMSRSTITNKMSWRFLVASSRRVDRFIIRDIDSRLSMRGRAAVDEWIKSRKHFHVMRDHPSHSLYAMSGGMWGGVGNSFPDMHNMLLDSKLRNSYLQDMNFLNSVIWPRISKNVMQHDAFPSRKFGTVRPFPTTRNGSEHIGSVYINGKIRQVDVDLLMRATISKGGT